MSALNRLANLLRGTAVSMPWHIQIDDGIDSVLSGLQRHSTTGGQGPPPEDLQQQAVRRFWDSGRLDSLREARLVSFGMCLPIQPSGPCLMEDRQRFRAALDGQSGVDQWVDDPRWYRRCYRGLVRSYFMYDAGSAATPPVGKKNWVELRDYLYQRAPRIVDKSINQDWVQTTVGNRQLFSDEPCASYAEAMLNGDSSAIDSLCEQLGIIKASWFLRELVLAQVRQAIKLDHEGFLEVVPRVLGLLAGNRVLRDEGLILVLDRYSAMPQQPLHQPLRDASVEWWGNPWLPSNEMRWGGVAPATRAMVSEWLKREFIEAFFVKLAEDGLGDRRRANFWLRYAKSMTNVQFALGSTAMFSRDKDFVTLRQKMKGLITELRTTDSSNNAFVMTMGSLVTVEFGSMGNALYGYDTRVALPFDVSKPVLTTKNARNSLKHDEPTRILWLQHTDGIHGWDRWEEMFEETLKKHFGISPNTVSKNGPAPVASPPPPPRRAKTTEPEQQNLVQVEDAILPYSRSALSAFAKRKDLKVMDLTHKNGNLWVYTGDNDPYVNGVLLSWKFRYRPGKGWWK